ncbi:response regulator [Alteribacter keqinensis]|uniref:Response regulator n=1 Tax=Alteribacter keqinensis TaxID=2483800 RepID=A0A3M7TNN1_9BACI|nr:response regulator [Alteribacter keqinensis]RNA67062.1 response regulator [Alteribacter keqinensis]
MTQSVAVLIVEDDFRVADITKRFVNKVDGFTVAGAAKTAKETRDFLEKGPAPDLILLDVYIPDVDGLSLFWEIRREYPAVDLVMVTAAKEVVTFEEALKGGIFDYIVKPVDLERLAQTLERYKAQRQTLVMKQELDQGEIDDLLQVGRKGSLSDETDLPKGIDAITLEQVKKLLMKEKDGITAVNVGKQIGASRSTARRYLEYLVSVNEVEARLKYGDVGRPERRYVTTR